MMMNRERLHALNDELKWHDMLDRALNAASRNGSSVDHPARNDVGISVGPATILNTSSHPPEYRQRLLNALRELRTDSAVRLAGKGMEIDPPTREVLG